MSTVAGYTFCFLAAGRVRMVTMAIPDDNWIERQLNERLGKIEVLSRTPLDAKALGLLKLKRRDWLE